MSTRVWKKTGTGVQFADSMGDEDFNRNEFKVGDYCAVKIGKNWNRCRIIDFDHKMALVECVDDCRFARLPVGMLEKLNPKFMKLGKFAFKCKLFGLNSTKLLTFNKNAIEKFKEIICEENKALIAEIVEQNEDDVFKNEFYEINLYIENKNIFDYLTEISL